MQFTYLFSLDPMKCVGKGTENKMLFVIRCTFSGVHCKFQLSITFDIVFDSCGMPDFEWIQVLHRP